MFKYIFRALAIIALILLTFAMLHFAYTVFVAALITFGIIKSAAAITGIWKLTVWGLSALLNITLVVPSIPSVWRKLSNVGQKIDEKIKEWWSKEKNYLYRAKELIDKSDTLVKSAEKDLSIGNYYLDQLQTIDYNRLSDNSKNAVKVFINKLLFFLKSGMWDVNSDRNKLPDFCQKVLQKYPSIKLYPPFYKLQKAEKNLIEACKLLKSRVEIDPETEEQRQNARRELSLLTQSINDIRCQLRFITDKWLAKELKKINATERNSDVHKAMSQAGSTGIISSMLGKDMQEIIPIQAGIEADENINKIFFLPAELINEVPAETLTTEQDKKPQQEVVFSRQRRERDVVILSSRDEDEIEVTRTSRLRYFCHFCCPRRTEESDVVLLENLPVNNQ